MSAPPITLVSTSGRRLPAIPAPPRIIGIGGSHVAYPGRDAQTTRSLCQEFLRRLLEFAERLLDPEDGRAKVAVQMWGNAAVDERVRSFAASKDVAIRAYFVRYAERASAEGILPTDIDPEVVGKTMFGLVPGFILQRLILRDVDAASYAAGLSGLLGTKAGAGVR